MTWHINSKPSTCSQEQEEESSRTFCLDTYLLGLAKSNPSPGASCSEDNPKDSCRRSQSGTTYEPSTETPGEEQLTFCAEDFPAKTLAQTEREQVSKDHVRDCGKNMHDWLEKCGLDLCLPKTPQGSKLKDLPLSSKILPRWGMMLDGVCWELGTKVRHIGEIDSFYWPTPTVAEANKIPATANYGQVGINNHPKIRGYPTRQKMGKDTKGYDGGTRIQPSVPKTKGQLNPSWVEWLMGWPIGWTDSRPLEMGKFHNVQQWHLTFYPED